MIELVCFDADGVLFNSDRANVAYYNAIFAHVGEPRLSRDEEVAAISYAAIEMFARRARGDAEKLARMHSYAKVIDNTQFFAMFTVQPNLRSFLLALKPRYRLGLATNRSATVPTLVEHLDLGAVFDAIASVLDNVRPKPAPDILALCLQRAGIDSSRAVYVGDSPIDLEAARAAGIHFVGVGPRVDHDHRIASIAELPEYLARLDRELRE